jgi:hypothetical protein
MRKYAFLKNNIVVLVDSIEPEEYGNHIAHWDAIIDIDGFDPEPKTGWILQGNALVPVVLLDQQSAQQVFGQKLALELVNMMGARNLLLYSQGVSVNIPALLTSALPVKMLIETGALKTARTAILASMGNFPQHTDVFQYAVNSINTFLQSKGWE